MANYQIEKAAVEDY